MTTVRHRLEEARWHLTRARRVRWRTLLIRPQATLHRVFTWSWITACAWSAWRLATLRGTSLLVIDLTSFVQLVGGLALLGVTLAVALPLSGLLAWWMPGRRPLRTEARGRLELALVELEAAVLQTRLPWRGPDVVREASLTEVGAALEYLEELVGPELSTP